MICAVKLSFPSLSYILVLYSPTIKIFKNNAPDSAGFTEQTSISLQGIKGDISWTDLDNDGDLDILLV
ncbi:FG-GAP repeat domain-containing protein, partial [Bacteroidota bacterium]